MSVRPAVVDSSGWIEVFTDGPQAGSFVAVLDSAPALVVPVISILEVFKWVLREHSEAHSNSSTQPCAARAHQARLYTLDADFKDLHDVELSLPRFQGHCLEICSGVLASYTGKTF